MKQLLLSSANLYDLLLWKEGHDLIHIVFLMNKFPGGAQKILGLNGIKIYNSLDWIPVNQKRKKNYQSFIKFGMVKIYNWCSWRNWGSRLKLLQLPKHVLGRIRT